MWCTANCTLQSTTTTLPAEHRLVGQTWYTNPIKAANSQDFAAFFYWLVQPKQMTGLIDSGP
jgi:hypothetical protein